MSEQINPTPHTDPKHDRYIGGQVFYITEQAEASGKNVAVWNRGEITKIVVEPSGLTIHLKWFARMRLDTYDQWKLGDELVHKFVRLRRASYSNGTYSMSAVTGQEQIKLYLYPPGHGSNIDKPKR